MNEQDNEQPKEYLKRWLEEQRNILQADLADAAVVTSSMVSQWMSGERPISVEAALLLEKKFKARGLSAEKLCPRIAAARASI